MLIALNNITKQLNTATANTFIESFQKIGKQIQEFSVMGDEIVCDDENSNMKSCKEVYNLTEKDYILKVDKKDTYYEVTLKAGSSGKFNTVNILKYGDVSIDDKTDKREEIDCKIPGFTNAKCRSQQIIGNIEF